MQDMLFDFSVILTDKDGDKLKVDGLYDPVEEIERFLPCNKTEAKRVLDRLKEDYEVYAAPCQIILTRREGMEIVHNFEIYGQSYWHGHKYNTVNEWDFRAFVSDNVSPEKRTYKPRSLSIRLNVTEKQLKRALQLDYARSIGFEIGWKDYHRFYLM